MSEKHKHTGFFDYFMHKASLLGEVCREVTNDMQVCRQWPWLQTFRPPGFFNERRFVLGILAKRWREPLSKLLFLAGVNPWADRLGWEDQVKLWEVIERMVKEKEQGRVKMRTNDMLAQRFFEDGSDDGKTEGNEDAMGNG